MILRMTPEGAYEEMVPRCTVWTRGTMSRAMEECRRNAEMEPQSADEIFRAALAECGVCIMEEDA